MPLRLPIEIIVSLIFVASVGLFLLVIILSMILKLLLRLVSEVRPSWIPRIRGVDRLLTWILGDEPIIPRGHIPFHAPRHPPYRK